MSHLPAAACAVLMATLPAVSAAADPSVASERQQPLACASGGHGYLKARIAGTIATEIDWRNSGTVCTGEARPQGGVRVSFKNKTEAGESLLIVFGILGAREGQAARALPANLTVVREGAAQFFSTQGDDKCTIDDLKQEPLHGAPHKERTYRIVVRGFCSEPARAVHGQGAVLLSRFDFASELHFSDDEESQPAAPTAPK